MKKTLLLLLIGLGVFAWQPVFAQESVDEATDFAEKLLKKVQNRRFKKFNEYYPQALKDMERIEKAAPETEFGYDELADKIPGWMRLNKVLARFDGGSVSNKGETVTFQIRDYAPLLEEARAKAAKAHYDAGSDLVENNTEYEKRKEAFTHFDKTSKYSDDYDDQMKQYKALVYYDEGVRISNATTDFNELIEGVNMFRSAEKQVENFKDSKERMATIYFNDGERLSKSDRINDMIYAIARFKSASEIIPDFKGANARQDEVKEKGASLLYAQALAKEKEQTFKAQEEAAGLFEDIGARWVKDYKDANERAKAAKARSKVDLFLVETDGTLVAPAALGYGLQEKTNGHIQTPVPSDELKKINLADASNFSAAEQLLGHGFVLIKMGEGAGAFKYSSSDPEVTTETYKVYYMIKTDAVTKEKTEKKISEEDYKSMQKIINLAGGEDGGTKFRIEEGKTTTTTISASLSADFPVEVWDVRDSSAPVKITTINVPQRFTDSKVKTTYSGAESAKPSKLRNDEGEVMTEEELVAKAKGAAPSVKSIVKSNMSRFVEVLDEKIAYRPL